MLDKNLAKKDIAKAAKLIIGLVFLALAGRWFAKDFLLEIILIPGIIIIVIFQMRTIRLIKLVEHVNYRLLNAIHSNKANNHASFSLHSFLPLRFPLPGIYEATILPDFANILVAIILERKPKRIFELGGGLSTLIAGYCLERLGEGSIISLDDTEKYASITRENIRLYGLEKFATIIDASTKKVEIHNEDYQWYDLERAGKIESIDLLVIDGPWKGRNRYPALPLLMPYLNDGAVILMDDGHREKWMAEKWMQEFDGIEMEFFNTAKGTILLKINQND